MDDFHCSFCGKRRSEVRYLVCGPRVFICSECTAACRQSLGPRLVVEPPVAKPTLAPAGVEAERRRNADLIDAAGGAVAGSRCSFCGKAEHQVRKLIAGREISICDVCVELAEDIVEEKTGVGGREGRS